MTEHKVERITVTDPKLKEREEAAIADLRALAPDGVIEGLDSRDKSLGKRLSKLYVRLGYESRKDMIEAFGFTLASKGGRPASVDPVQVVDMICEHCRERAPFSSIREIEVLLMAEQPDIASKFKTVKNSAQAVFGRTLKAELQARGLLVKTLFEDEEMEAALNDLVSRYAEASQKPETVKVLFKAHSEYAPMEQSLVRYIAKRYDSTPKEYFSKMGVIQSAAVSSADGFDDAIRDVKLRLAGLANDDLPGSLSDLIEMFPEHAEVLAAAEKKKLLTVNKAKDQGLLRTGKEKYRERRDYLIERSIRNASLAGLKAIWREEGLPLRIDESMEEAQLLPMSISLIDLEDNVEERKTYRAQYVSANPEKKPKERFLLKLKRLGGTQEVISEVVRDGYLFMQARVRIAGALRPQTLAYALWKAGALTDVDLKLTDAWRIRYADVLTSDVATEQSDEAGLVAASDVAFPVSNAGESASEAKPFIKTDLSFGTSSGEDSFVVGSKQKS